MPQIEFLREFAATVPNPPPQIIEGILHQGCKMILGGTSKSNKSRALLDLSISVLRWDYPLLRVAPDLNPDALRRPQAKNKVCSDKDFVDAVITSDGKSFTRVVNDAKDILNMSPRTTATYLKRLVAAGSIIFSAGLYWIPTR